MRRMLTEIETEAFVIRIRAHQVSDYIEKEIAEQAHHHTDLVLTVRQKDRNPVFLELDIYELADLIGELTLAQKFINESRGE